MLPPLPARPARKPTKSENTQYIRDCETFAGWLIAFDQTRPDPTASRSWAYLVEGAQLIAKDQFDQFNELLTEMRKGKMGLLPVDFCAQDVSRTVLHTEEIDPCVEDYAEDLIESIQYAHEYFSPLSAWDYQNTYVEVVVEKIDLLNLFKRECARWSVPISSAKGWSDLYTRAGILSRANKHPNKRLVLLYCGDFDPAGKLISDKIEKNLRSLDGIWWRDGDQTVYPEHLEIVRFGMNREFIEENNLIWINNLKTSAKGKDKKPLNDPSHPDYHKEWVQSWLREVGVRKCEANAMVTVPEASARLMRDTLETYLDPEGRDGWVSDMKFERRQLAEVLPIRIAEAFG